MTRAHHTPKIPSEDELQYLSRYDVDTSLGKVSFGGKEVGHLGNHGYVVISGRLTGVGRNRKKHLRHHIVWWAHYGAWPSNLLDHGNGIITDDSISNLILSSTRDNPANSPRRRDTGMPTGVMKNKYGRFEARIGVNGRIVFLGTRLTPEEAGCLYQEAKERLGANQRQK